MGSWCTALKKLVRGAISARRFERPKRPRKGGFPLKCVPQPPLEVSSAGIYLSAANQCKLGPKKIYSMKNNRE